MKFIRREKRRILLIAGFLIGFFLLMDLFGRLTELSRLSRERDRAEVRVTAMQQTIEVLQTQIAYATSEGAVEEWARGEGHMAIPGDSVVIPLTPQGATLVPITTPTPTPQSYENWEIWEALFFGE